MNFLSNTTATTTIDQDVPTIPTAITTTPTTTVTMEEVPVPLNKLVVEPMVIEKEIAMPKIIMTSRPKVLTLNTFFTTSVLSPVHNTVHK